MTAHTVAKPCAGSMISVRARSIERCLMGAASGNSPHGTFSQTTAPDETVPLHEEDSYVESYA